jgi:hypothetical protein
MPNTLTDQYALVKTTTLDVNFIQLLLGKTVNYNDGFSRELFREGKHLRSLRAPTDSISARKGDTLLAVNTGIVTAPFTDKLPTRDGYFITYDATVRLFVEDARTFAIGYVQGIDPLQKTVDVILAALKREVARGQHDQMSDEYLRGVVEHETGIRRPLQLPWGMGEATLVVEYGVAILDAQTMSPRADPKRVAEIEEAERVAKERERLRREKEIELAKIEQQKNIRASQHDLDLHKQKDAQELDLGQWKHDRFKQEEGARRDAALEMEIEAARLQESEDRAQLRRLREQGIPTARIVQEYPELRYLLERRNLRTGELENEADLAQLTARIVEVESLRTHAVSHSNGIWTIGHMNIKVSRHELSEQEAELAQKPAQSLSYLVVEVIPPGQQDSNGGLRAQDLIYEIDKKPVVELADLAPYLDECQRRDGAVTVTYLRGEYSGVAVIVIPNA